MVSRWFSETYVDVVLLAGRTTCCLLYSVVKRGCRLHHAENTSAHSNNIEVCFPALSPIRFARLEVIIPKCCHIFSLEQTGHLHVLGPYVSRPRFLDAEPTHIYGLRKSLLVFRRNNKKTRKAHAPCPRTHDRRSTGTANGAAHFFFFNHHSSHRIPKFPLSQRQGALEMCHRRP